MNLTRIVELVIALVSTLISIFLIPWIRSKTSSEDLKNLQAWVEIAVAAAEQLYGSELRLEKKRWVLNYLESNGFIVDPSIDSMVEAEVLKLHRELYGEWEDDGD